ncbi:MAG: hypothetical protein JO053_10130 [Acidobacteria bacterium]|nr:hypothetical protein [Acidobacteriota bacterium]
MAEEFFISRQETGDLLNAAAFIGERIKSADGHAEAMKAIVPMFLERGNVDLAAELANQIVEPFSRDKLLTQIAVKCADMDDDDYAMQLADAIEDDGLRSQAFESIAMVKSNKDQFEKAREIAGMMNHPDYVYAGIAVGEARAGNKEASEKALTETEFASAKVSALEHIAAAAIENNEIDRAVEMLDRAADVADEIEHDEERIRAFCDIGNLFYEGKRNDKAIDIYDLARDNAEQLDNIHKDNFLSVCALGFLFAGSDELCERTLDLVMDKTQMASALLGRARFEWQNDKKQDAVDSLEEAFEILRSQRDLETRDSRARNALMGAVAVQFATFENAERGIEAAQKNDDPDETTAALSQIAQILVLRQNDDLARQAINEIPDDAGRLGALVGAADAKLRLKETDAAMAFLDEAATLADSVPQYASRANVLSEIADRFFSQGMIDRGRQIAADSLAVVAEIKDETTQAAALASLSNVYSEHGIEPGEAEAAIVKRLVDRLD